MDRPVASRLHETAWAPGFRRGNDSQPANSGARLQSEAWERLAAHGSNELNAKASVPRWRKVLSRFTDVLVLLLIGAAIRLLAAQLFDRRLGITQFQ